MLRERKKQIGWDALECVLTRGPAVLYGFFLLGKPDAEIAVYAGLAAAAAALILKMTLVLTRRPIIHVLTDNEAEVPSMGAQDPKAMILVAKKKND